MVKYTTGKTKTFLKIYFLKVIMCRTSNPFKTYNIRVNLLNYMVVNLLKRERERERQTDKDKSQRNKGRERESEIQSF